jgi:phosphoribosylanthranilate isomerase
MRMNAVQPLVKICGITRPEDAVAAAAVGAYALGLVFYPPSPRHVDLAQALAICQAAPEVQWVGLFVDPQPQDVEQVLAQVPLNILQFHGEEPAAFCSRFGLPYWKAARMKPDRDLRRYADAYPQAQALLLDAYVQGVAGGSGERFDWEQVPAALPVPVVLSGGLTPENVAAGIRRVRPWAVDVSSGVEREKGIKDAARMAAFMQGVQHATV